ncbi:hypothetical protein DXD46_23185, partial [Phocaeicola vulgatus]
QTYKAVCLIPQVYRVSRYLHKLWSYLPRLWSQLQRLVEIKQAGRKPLTIRRERVRDMDKIF